MSSVSPHFIRPLSSCNIRTGCKGPRQYGWRRPYLCDHPCSSSLFSFVSTTSIVVPPSSLLCRRPQHTASPSEDPTHTAANRAATGQGTALVCPTTRDIHLALYAFDEMFEQFFLFFWSFLGHRWFRRWNDGYGNTDLMNSYSTSSYIRWFGPGRCFFNWPAIADFH